MLDEAESAKFCLSCLTDLMNRDLADIFVVCVDGLSGFTAAIQTANPNSKTRGRIGGSMQPQEAEAA